MNNDSINFFELPVNDLLLINLILSIFLANRLNGNQLNILGNFVCALGQNLLTIQAVIGALPDDAVYTICTNPAYTDSSMSDTTSQPNVESINNELQQLKAKLQALECSLIPQKG